MRVSRAIRTRLLELGFVEPFPTIAVLDAQARARIYATHCRRCGDELAKFELEGGGYVRGFGDEEDICSACVQKARGDELAKWVRRCEAKAKRRKR